MWNSLQEIWTSAFAPHIPQALIFVEWLSHQGRAVVININILACLVLILIWHFEMQALYYN